MKKKNKKKLELSILIKQLEKDINLKIKQVNIVDNIMKVFKYYTNNQILSTLIDYSFNNYK